MNARTHKRFFIGMAILAVAMLLACLIFRKGNREDPTPDTTEDPIELLDSVSPGSDAVYDAIISPGTTVEVPARVEGYLEKILFTEGTYVKKGQTLFIIDDAVYRANVDRARAELDKARAILEKSERDLNRIRPLFNQNAASQVDLDNAEAALSCARADVSVCEANLRQATLNLQNTRVVAPISGYISDSMADIGALVGPSGGKSQLASIVICDSVMVDFDMPVSDYQEIALPATVSILRADGSEYPLKGVLDCADIRANPKDASVSVRAMVPNPDSNLRPGASARVKLNFDK